MVIVVINNVRALFITIRYVTLRPFLPISLRVTLIITPESIEDILEY